MYIGIRYSCQILMKLEFSRQNFEKYSNIIFYENPSSESRIVPRGRPGWRTDITKLIIDFRNFVNAPKNSCHRTDRSINRNLEACQNF